MNQHLKIWEISLLAALCFTLCTGMYARATQAKLSSELVRLHIIANSDSNPDQAAKLKVRDCVLQVLTPKLQNVNSIDEAQKVINSSLPELQQTAEQSLHSSGMNYPAAAFLRFENYPTRVYDGFSLPAGNYLSLQITLGNGDGHNWWCVVFPPLCMASAEDESAFSGLSDDDTGLIKESDSGYKLKFRIVEIYGEIRQYLT